jgi:hypothetical protein
MSRQPRDSWKPIDESEGLRLEIVEGVEMTERSGGRTKAQLVDSRFADDVCCGLGRLVLASGIGIPSLGFLTSLLF